MSEGRPTYDELKTMYGNLLMWATRVSLVQQEPINTRDSLDRESARFMAIQSYIENAIHAKSAQDFAKITLEAIVEAFEVECSALFTYDKPTKSLTKNANRNGAPIAPQIFMTTPL